MRRSPEQSETRPNVFAIAGTAACTTVESKLAPDNPFEQRRYSRWRSSSGKRVLLRRTTKCCRTPQCFGTLLAHRSFAPAAVGAFARSAMSIVVSAMSRRNRLDAKSRRNVQREVLGMHHFHRPRFLRAIAELVILSTRGQELGGEKRHAFLFGRLWGGDMRHTPASLPGTLRFAKPWEAI